MNPNIIAIGYSGAPRMDIVLICNDEGLKQIPEPLEYYTDGGGNLHNGARVALTKTNLVALRMIKVLSDNDIKPMLAKLEEPI